MWEIYRKVTALGRAETRSSLAVCTFGGSYGQAAPLSSITSGFAQCVPVNGAGWVQWAWGCRLMTLEIPALVSCIFGFAAKVSAQPRGGFAVGLTLTLELINL